MIDNEEHIPIEPTPKIRSKSCMVVALGMYTFFTLFPFIVALGVYWWLVSYWLAFLAALAALLIRGVVIAKMRVASIPFAQRELTYNTKAVIAWYLSKNYCFDEE